MYFQFTCRLSQSSCEALRRWRRQQILTGDTNSIKGMVQHPDLLWRASCCLPGSSNAPPPNTTGCFYYLFHTRYLLMFEGHGHALPWRTITAAFSCFSPLTAAKTLHGCQVQRKFWDWLPAFQAATCCSSFQSIWKSTSRDLKLAWDKHSATPHIYVGL